MSGMSAALVWCPFPDEDSAAATADALLREGLIACANLIPGMRSLYVWRGEHGEARETGALLKTSGVLLNRTVERLAELHPYDTPAVVGWSCDAASMATLAWLEEIGGARA